MCVLTVLGEMDSSLAISGRDRFVGDTWHPELARAGLLRQRQGQVFGRQG
jgi:hypothetical protein